MFSYYGAKTNVVDLYPAPRHDKVIEPFAGSARYALKYFERDVLLVDKYEVIVKIWKWLQKCSVGDIKKLPRLTYNERISDFNFDCVEAEHLCGFLVGFSNKRPRKTGSTKLLQRKNFMNFRLNQVAENLHKIRHWDIRMGAYDDIANQKATWFIDPPYEGPAGNRYVYGSNGIDYNRLRNYCKDRDGQVIVCEGANASWLPFNRLSEQRTNKKMSSEMVWLNEKSIFDNLQIKINYDFAE